MLSIPELGDPSVTVGVNFKSMNPHFGDFGITAEARQTILTTNSTKEGTFTYQA
jgi:hypothetical protein